MSIKPHLYIVLAVLLPVFQFFCESVAASPADSLDALRNARDWVGLGYAYLERGDFDDARKAFRRGARGDSAAAAYNGMGLAYGRDPKAVKRKAFEYFRRALGVDKGYLEARMNIARLHIQLGDLNAEHALEDVIEAHPTYAPAYLMLADWFRDSLFPEKRIALYNRYLEIVPGEIRGYQGLAMTYIELHNYPEALKALEPALTDTSSDSRLLPLAAQAHAALGDPERAVALFQAYFHALPDSERTLYEDLSLVTFPAELENYTAKSGEEKAEWLRDFWKKRDMALVSAGKAREAEHYRRVWHARTFFGEKVFPWDRRGEVYIRYGEPEYRARSDRVNAYPPSLAVQRVRDVHGQRIYGVYDTKSDLERPKGWTLKDESAMTEEWVYTKVAGGLQLLITDEMRNGQWDFPSGVPGNDISLTSKLMSLHPAVVYRKATQTLPDFYDVPPGMEPIEFYYDTASFRGPDHQGAELEVYFGVPLDLVESEETDGRELSNVRMVAALTDTSGAVYRRRQTDLVFPAPQGEQAEHGTFAPDLIRIDVTPGDYRLAVQLVDRISGKWGVYLQDLNVPDFVDSLAISDLQLCWDIRESTREGKFRKESLWVLPMPSRSFRQDTNIHIYYELYNLQTDAFGRTRYRVSYSIQRDARLGKGFFGALSSMVRRIVAAEEDQVIVNYDRTGDNVMEAIYFELDAGNLGPGFSRIRVSVTDLNGLQSATRTAIFHVE
ncbi:MAG: tetratricopeptide repeat protein [Gemmatimonadota bacterium]|nr:tetratricopeptide repeat protein [Gemmatimonadota bacterium]